MQAAFPFLAANLIDEATGRAVDWPNVRPSTVVTVAGLRVGIIGVMTAQALAVTVAANTGGLRVAPLAETIAAEAKQLRARARRSSSSRRTPAADARRSHADRPELVQPDGRDHAGRP